MDELKPGRYQHFKGKFYEIVAVARNSETQEEMVVYRTLYKHEKFGEKSWWVRPKNMFLETVEVDGKRVPRFKYIDDIINLPQ